MGTVGAGVDGEIGGELVDDDQAASAVMVVGGFGAPPAKVTDLDIEGAIVAMGDAIGELAGLAGGGIGVFDGVGRGFAQRDVQIIR